jgi:hypothetical protein
LRELLDRLAELGALDVQELARVAVEGIEHERARLGEDLVDVADDEERPDLAALAALPRDLHGELDYLLQGLSALLGAEGALAYRAEGRVQPLSALVAGHHPSLTHAVGLLIPDG